MHKVSKIRLFEHSLSFAEFQFNGRIVGKLQMMSNVNWSLEINILNGLCILLGDLHFLDWTVSTVDTRRTCQKAIGCFEKSRSLLERWRLLIQVEESKRTNSLYKEKMNRIYGDLSHTENRLYDNNITLLNLEITRDYNVLLKSHANQVMGERNTRLLCNGYIN